MMDPLSALSIAASVVQFVDFGMHLLSASYEIYKSPSGESAKEVDLATISKDLIGLVAQIKDNLETSARVNPPRSVAEHQLVQISEECEESLSEFNRALDELRSKIARTAGGKSHSAKLKMARGAIRKALANMWSSSAVDRMNGQLEKIKGRLVTATLFCLWDGSKRSEHRDVQFSERLDDMIAMLRRLDDRVDKMGQEPMHRSRNTMYSGLNLPLDPSKSSTEMVIDALNDERSPEGVRIQKELVEYLWNKQWTPAQQRCMERDSAAGSNESTMLQSSFCDAIVESLIFENMEGREEAIPWAFEKTFSWVSFQEPTELYGKKLWSSFPGWLESSTEQPYWITGKPGSGKSTLIKFVLQQPSLKAHLQKWAGDFDLLITSYYAWVAGSDLQKSCEGLMRTLLYQTLKLNPSLVTEVAPRRWSLFVTLRSLARMPTWQLWEIEESFEILLSNHGRTTRLALFVDGLDEFNSPPLKVLELVQNINSRSSIKVCVASRQWTEFNDTFHQSPMLRMQDLTTADMAHFVETKLEGNRGFLELKRIFPREATHLIGDIVKKADGVFLWVSLVVRSLLEALTEGDGLLDLQTAVDRLPSDIAQLYDAIWSRISPRNIVESAKLLVLFKATTTPLSYLTLWLADQKQPLDFNIRTLSDEGRLGIWNIMNRRLDSRTRGILELSINGTVTFLHRTARDWAFQPCVWREICSNVPEDFDHHLALLIAETLSTADRFNYQARGGIDSLWPQVHRTLWHASQVKQLPSTAPELVQILNKFDKEVDEAISIYLATEGTRIHKGTQAKLHWSSIGVKEAHKLSIRETTTSLSIKENTFLGLIAQFCILPYLRTQPLLELSSTKLKTETNFVSLLESAVFGQAHIANPRTSISTSQRVEAVRLLLERGASPKQVMSNGKTIMNEVQAASAAEAAKGVRWDKSDDDLYWARIEELMETKLRSKRTIKSMFGLRNRS